MTGPEKIELYRKVVDSINREGWGNDIFQSKSE